MIQLKKLINEAGDFTAKSKESGKLVHFKTKDSYDKAIKAGSHEDPNKDTSKGDAKSGVNIFGTKKAPEKSEPNDKVSEKPKASASDLAVDKVVYNTRTKNVGIVRLPVERGEVKTDADGNVNVDELEPYNPMKYPHQKDANVAPSTQKEVDSRGLWNPFAPKSDEPKLEPGSLSKFIYGDPNKEPDVVAKPVGNVDTSKFEFGDKDWFTKGHATMKMFTNDNLNVDDLKNLFKAKGYGEVTDKTFDDEVAEYLEDDYMRDQLKDRGINKSKFIKRIKDLKSQLQSTTSTPSSAPTTQRKGDPAVNKEVRKIAQKMGISSDKMDKNEYQKKMAQAAVAALTDSNFHSEARELVAALEGKPELAEKPDYPNPSDPKFREKMDVIKAKYDSVYSSPDDDAQDLGVAASQAAGWSGDTAIDGIAFELRMNGFHKLADKIQSVIKEGKVNRTSLKNLMK
jgi:hypothetical protein